MSIGDFPESLNQAMLVGTMLVGRLGLPSNREFSDPGGGQAPGPGPPNSRFAARINNSIHTDNDNNNNNQLLLLLMII